RIFLGGAQGYVISEGTQHNPKPGFGNIAVTGNLKKMSLDYIRGVTIPKYGTSLFVGIGIPIPILSEENAKSVAVSNADIKTNVLDYGVPRLQRPVLKETSYEELLSGEVEINGFKVKTSPLSSLKIASRITKTLKKWIEAKEFYLTEPAEHLPSDTVFKPMKVKSKTPPVSEVMSTPVITIGMDGTLTEVSNLLVENSIDQVPVVDGEGRLAGIITSWDITKATAEGKKDLRDIMTTGVVYSKPNESLEEVSRKLEKYSINATPVVDESKKVIGIITLTDINKIYRRMTQ
ncbi:MAG: CBS domain-containing protein, partial [Candidatus Altiarchaeota archaeon]|nr:CBS domain-containing protein [Candidatus Altiarchaeota archaeon]